MQIQKIISATCCKHVLLATAFVWIALSGLKAQINTVIYKGTYSDITIPDPSPSASLTLTAVGGDGGKIQRDYAYRGGRGALVRAIFSIGTGQGQLEPGGTLRFLVGGQGESENDMSNADMAGAGGGGGTGIAYRSPAGKWTLLLVAGGGGGGTWKGGSTNFDGGPGRAYAKENIGDGGPSGFYFSGDDYNSGAGAFESTPKNSHDMQSDAGWPGGPNSGEPIGGDAYDQGKEYYYSGGWGFGAGGIGQRGGRETGGGGGYTGGESGGSCPENTCYRDGTNDHRFGKYDYMPSYGGFSYVNETDMTVTGIFTFERGHATDPQNGYAIYEFRTPAQLYDFIQLNKDKSKCFEDYNTETSNGNNIQLGTCVDQDKQRWYFYDNRSIILAKDAGKCLDLDNSNTNNGTNIQLWDCNNSDAQRWVYDGITKNIRSGINFTKCIDLVNGKAVDGNNLQLWDCNDIGAQRWYVDRATTTTTSDTSNRIFYAKDVGKCIDVQSANTANGTNVQIYHCHKAESQYWYFDGNTIRFNKDRNKCLDLSNSNINNGTNIQLWDCDDTDAQHWVYDGMTRSFRSFVHGGKCLDVVNSGTADHTNIQLYDCNGSDAQQFEIGN